LKIFLAFSHLFDSSLHCVLKKRTGPDTPLEEDVAGLFITPFYAGSGGENILRRNFSLSSQENIATGIKTV
jgi:hypothetical protein